MVNLVSRSGQCSGCGACLNACPRNAIEMKPDDFGFSYPQISHSLCIGCGRCLRVCPFKVANTFAVSIRAFAAVHRSPGVWRSSSGGTFLALASGVIRKGGVVFGVGWNQDMVAEHMMVDSTDNLYRLQGSKYVQSDQKRCYSVVKELLQKGLEVLYSGTPCQIAGLLKFLGEPYHNLYTVDVVCHGVPSEQMHSAYIKYLEGLLDAKVADMNYREKSNGWSLRLKVDYEKRNVKKSKRFEYSDSYYYYYFEQALTLRDSCYQCPFARMERVSDITLGDYWGVEDYHPDIATRQGVSAVLVNSTKGLELIGLSQGLFLVESKPEWVAAGNGQLTRPSSCDYARREEILMLWREGGARALAAEYKVSLRQRIRNRLVMYTPYTVKDGIKRRLRRVRKSKARRRSVSS